MDRDRQSRNRRSNDAYGTKKVNLKGDVEIAEPAKDEGTWATTEAFSPSDVRITDADLLDNDVETGDDVGIRVIIQNDNDVKAECDVDVLIAGAYSGKVTSGTNPPANGSWRVSGHFGAPMSGGSYTISVRLSNVGPA